MTTLHLVDATYELFRANFGAPPRETPAGEPIGAVYGLLSSLIAMIRDEEVTHLGCATDHVVRSFRNDLWPGYKTEAGVPEELLSQFGPAEEGLRALGVTVWPMTDFEADDGIASAITRFRHDFERIVICSPDKDFAQLVEGDRIVLRDRRRSLDYDASAVHEKWGVPPSAIADLLALMGDSADGFPGLPGWGAKTAATVLEEYGSIEAIPLDAAEWTVKVRGAVSRAETLREQLDDALLFKRLATLRTDAPIEESSQDLATSGVPAEGFDAYCERQGFPKLAERARALR
ncbi:MAG: 5'-3' exonuclease H3TH domain-containing protein [Planctomycetota bacterium]